MGLLFVWHYFNNQAGAISSVNFVSDIAVPDGFSRADGNHIWDFPKDFGPHPEYQTEWWYYTGNLVNSDGRRFGYQLTFFRRGLLPPEDWAYRDSKWGVNQVYMGHFAVSDIATQEHYAFERFSRGAAGLAGSQAEPFQVWLEDWEIEQVSDNEWRMLAQQDGVGLDLLLTDEKGITLQGINGYSQKGPDPGNASYYFSQTRLTSEGTVRIKEEAYKVSGLSWMDHEFSTSALSDGQVGWDWFSLQLDEGTDLMVFQIRREDGSVDPFSSGVVIDNEGVPIQLSRDQFEIQVTDTWRSPQSGAVYPSAWTLMVPSIELVLDIQPYMADQEMNVSYSYWEGAVSVRGMYQAMTLSGSGYVELTGYAASMENEF
jgi:predicted secreted hydrolase